MKVTDELKDYSYTKICDDYLKVKKFIKKYIKISFYCTVCSSVTSLTHTSEEAKDLLEYDSKDKSLKFHFFYMFCDYVMFLFRNKRFYSSNF